MKIESNQVLFHQQFNAIDQIHKHWGWFLILGIGLIILGVLAIGAATMTTLLSVLLLGSLLLAGGILQIIYSFWARRWSGFFLTLLAGILYVVVGGLLVTKPVQGALGITLLLAAFYVVSGIFRMIGAAMMRFDNWGWVFFSGIISFVLGLLIWADWPISGLWILGLFIGIDLLFIGWAWVILSISAKNYEPTQHI